MHNNQLIYVKQGTTITAMGKDAKIEKLKSKEHGFNWLAINNPNEDSIAYLKRHYKFHPLDLEDCLSETQRSKIDEYDDYLFIVLHIPVRGRKGQIKSSEIIGGFYFFSTIGLYFFSAPGIDVLRYDRAE